MPLSNANAKGPMKNNPLFTNTNKVGPEPTNKTNTVTTDIDDNITSNNRFKPAATTKKNKRENRRHRHPRGRSKK